MCEYITDTNESESIKSESERSCTYCDLGKHKGHSKLGVKCCHRSLKFLHSFLHINSVLLCQYSILVVTVVRCLVGAEYLTFTETSTNLLDWIMSVQTWHFIVSLFLSWLCPVLRPCGLLISFFAAGQKDLGLLLVVELSALADFRVLLL